MLHFKRLLWLAAWGVWLWLGFGLHRALPRDLGPVACSHLLGERTSFVGFLGDESKFVTVTMRDRDKPSSIAVWDAFTGHGLSRFDGPIGAEGTEYEFHPKRAFAVGRRVGRDHGLSALDIRTGEWIDLPPEANGARVFHPVRPWVMFWEWAVDEIDGGSVFVFDLKSGTKLFQWSGRRQGSPPRDLHRLPFFIGDRIGINTRKPATKDGELEVWSMTSKEKPDLVAGGVSVEDDVQATLNGRVLWHASRNEIDVYDLSVGRFVYCDPPHDQREGPPIEIFSSRFANNVARLSPDGRYLHGLDRGRVWDLDRDRECWIDQDGQRLMHLDARGRMEILEEWQIPGWEEWREETYAVRDAATGSLLYRTWKMCLDVRNAEDTLHVEFDGDGIRIHHLPPPINWPLLAVCQTILALPLILLWAVLKWRSRRAARREGAEVERNATTA